MRFTSNLTVVDLLGVMFVGLKLADAITWSWFWVLIPFFVTFILKVTYLVFDE